MTNKWLWIAVTALVWILAAQTWSERCESAWLRYGMEARSCPDGEPRQTAEVLASGVRRGEPGRVRVTATAHFVDRWGRERTAAVPAMRDLALALVHGRDETPVALDGETVKLPVVPDGDYQLRARFRTLLGPAEVSAALPLYAPARVHVITDRPLYRPGDTVRFRAVVVRARDLAPIEQRPGRWVVRVGSDAENVVLEESAPSGPWGVVAGSFPLDRAALTGTWSVEWRSGDSKGGAVFGVQPFTLPRFRVDALAERPFYRAGDAPVIKGAVVYSSGAPVAHARLDVTWRSDGAWPLPTSWLAGELPQHAEADDSGHFALALPRIPGDLQHRTVLSAAIAAVDRAGDRVEGGASVLLSQDAIAVSAVTELGDGLVESFNNRLYLRVTTPDGRALAGKTITVARAWIAGDPGVPATLDEDGVASLQVDPGKPVSLIIPPAPYRPPPPAPVVVWRDAQEQLTGKGASLADQRSFDSWLPRLAPCASELEGADQRVALTLRADRSGALAAVATDGTTGVPACVADRVRRERLPAGGDRLYRVVLQFRDPDAPRLVPALVGDSVEGLDAQIAALARGARACLPATPGPLARMLTWRARGGARDVELTGWIDDPTAPGAAMPACVTQRLAGARLQLASAAEHDGVGAVRFAIALPEAAASERPQPTTMLGYQLIVTAEADATPGSGEGSRPAAPPAARADRSTIVRLKPGEVPPLRLRVSPVIAKPGEQVTVEVLRGPAYSQPLPVALTASCVPADKPIAIKDRRASFTPAGAGWCTIEAGGAHTLAYVQPAGELAVRVTPDQDRYKPGERATLRVQTTVGGAGHEAAVGLFGVDESLGQLAPLPGPDALAQLSPPVETPWPAFELLDGQALALGRIRGANAAAATVLRVTRAPAPEALDVPVSAAGRTAFDPGIELADRFYVALAELHAQVRAWEARPGTDKMTPATMAQLWRAALAACAARGERITDAYGRPLALSRLPAELLAQTDPRAVVVQATRLPEDVENWPAWVAREEP